MCPLGPFCWQGYIVIHWEMHYNYIFLNSVSCAPGSYQKTETVYIEDAESSLTVLQPVCEFCPLGYYQNRQGQTSCEQCPPGYTTWNNSSQLFEDCYKECDNGYYSTNGLEPCSRCPNGTYSTQKGSTMCRNCSVSIPGYCELPKSTSEFHNIKISAAVNACSYFTIYALVSGDNLTLL